MQDEEINLVNACTDLVSLKKYEAFTNQLLGTRPPGEWLSVRESCLRLGLAPADLKSDLFASWLPDPMAHEDYSVIIFYDDESKWSMAAHYNRGRLLRGATPYQGEQPAGAAISASS